MHEYANPPYAVGWLRARNERPRRPGAAEKRNELAPFQLTELHPLRLAEAA
jgi:hypothetical protein